MNYNSLTANELETLNNLLNKLQPGFLPLDVFLQVARLVTLPIVELVLLRQNQGEVEVLLLERESDDPVWPGMLHSPGTVIRATDGADYSSAFERITSDELKGTQISEPHFVTTVLNQSKRGKEDAHVYWAEVKGEPQAGAFYKFANLPNNFIDSQRLFIAKAVENFRETIRQ